MVWRFSRFEPVISKRLSAPPFAFSLSSPNISFTFRPETSFTVLGVVEFSDQGRAVEHQHPLFDPYHLHPFPGQGFANFPLPSLDIHLSMAVELQYPTPGAILPARRMGIVAPRTGPPTVAGVCIPSASCGRTWLCSQRYASSQVCVFSSGQPRRCRARCSDP